MSEDLIGKCPACSDHPELHELEDREIPFLGCTTCFGLFVTEDNLREYVVDSTGCDKVAEAFDELMVTALAKQGGETKRVCPECGDAMRRMGFGEAPFMILDRCQTGHGLWLDKKELKKAVRTSRARAVVLGLIPAHDDAEAE